MRFQEICKRFPLAIIAFSFFQTSNFAQDTLANPPVVAKSKNGWIKIERMASLSEPWGMAWLGEGKLLISEKPGNLRVFENGKLSEPIIGLPAIEYHGQGGLLDVEADPAFSSNKFVYFYFVERAENQPNISREPGDPRLGVYQDYEDVVLKGGAVARGRLEGNELKDVKIIWRQNPKFVGRGHFGGRLAFGADGNLFITSGDRQRFDPAQSNSSNVGKIVRIKSDGSIPPDNPFAKTKGASGDIWTVGHRNPLGLGVNPMNNQLWETEMGPSHGDEINLPVKGKNYGWPKVSNGDNYDGSRIPDHETQPNFAGPVDYWHPSISPSGIAFYQGTMFPEWKANILMGSFGIEGLVRLTIKDNKVEKEERIPLQRRIRDVIIAKDGSIWLITDYKQGELIKLTPIGVQKPG